MTSSKTKILGRLLVAFACLTVFSACQKPNRVTIQTPTAQISISVEIARTPEEKATGLMYRTSLPEGQGMLFPYDKPSPLSFWMKNTLIPLDILYIGSDFRIKHISENTPPCPPETVCPSYVSPEPVQYVLELNGGAAKRQKINPGDMVDLSTSLN